MKNRRRKKTVPEIFTVVEIEDFETVCRVCEAEFLDGSDLKLHVAQVHMNESHGKTICKLCCAVLSGPDEFVSHFILKHLESCVFCFYCYRVFSDSSLLDQHELKHCAVEDDSALTCSQCCTILINRQELQNHEYQEHASSDDGLMLNGYFSLLSSALSAKIRKFIDNACRNKAIVCRRCSHTSLLVSDYIEHLKSSKCRCFACDKCFNVYKKKCSIIRHMVSKPQCHYFYSKKDIQKLCPKCNKSFDLKDFTAHKKFCNIIKCFTCQRIFDSMYELTEHRDTEHNAKISLETCKYCKKQFVGTLSLKKHMSRSHKDRNQYKYHCVHCDSRYNHPSRLFAHFFTQHKEIQPYTCKICNKCYRLRKHFTIHIKLEHKSVGFVEFDENLHVVFTNKKSENPIAAQANLDMDSTSDPSDSDSNLTPKKRPRKRNAKLPEHKDDMSSRPQDNKNVDATELNTSPENTDVLFDSNENNLNDNSNLTLPVDSVQIEIERLDEEEKEEYKEEELFTKEIKIKKRPRPETSDSSEEEPLSNVRESLLKQKTQIPNLKKRMSMRDKRAKLTCKICNKYCYTVQNFHHHMTLHEKSKKKRCIKCSKYFESKKELKDHIESSHSSSKLIETLKSVVEKRKKLHPVKPSESFKSVLERRRRQQLAAAQNSVNKFHRTIRKVEVVDNCTATMTPMSDHGLSVKNFIENFKPEADGLNISNSVTLKAMTTPVNKEPFIKMRAFKPETYPEDSLVACSRLRFPVKFKDEPVSYMDTKISVKLVQQLITKPSAVNMIYNERIPPVQEKSESDDYCNMFADETDYTQYKNESIPEVAQEVMLEDLEDIPRTRRLAQEIIIPKISEEHGGVRIGHLLPQAPYYKIVKVKKLLNASNEEPDNSIPEKDVKLPDGTRLVSVKNPYSHLIPNEHLAEILKANRTKYYTPKTKNIEKAIAKALNPPPRKRGRKRTKKDS